MVNFTTTTTPIEDLLIIEPKQLGVNSDLYSEFLHNSPDALTAINAEREFTESVSGKYQRGLMSGLHFNRRTPQAKLVRVLSGSILAVAVDLRPESRTYGASHSVEISDENERLFYIPRRFAFGFLTLEQNSTVEFLADDTYSLEADSGIAWNDHILAINWQFERYDIDEKWLKISKKDKKLPHFRQYSTHTLWSPNEE